MLTALVLPLVLVLLVVALHLFLVWGGSFPGDHWALAQEYRPHSTWAFDYAKVFQELGTPVVAILLVAVSLALILRYGSRREAAGLVIVCLAVPLNALLKLMLGPSPLWFRGHSSDNYPSGHTTFTVAVIGYLGLVAWQHGQRWLAALAALLLIAVGPARLVTGIHLVSDVVAGYLVGAAMLLIAWRVALRTRS